MIQLNYRDSKPIYEQIKDGFRKLIISNSIFADEKLPSVRELASSLAINPNTIQRAYHDLENEGYIYTVAGKGSFVAAYREAACNVRQNELLEEFDEIVEELYFLSIKKKDLLERIDSLEGGSNLPERAADIGEKGRNLAGDMGSAGEKDRNLAEDTGHAGEGGSSLPERSDSVEEGGGET